MRVGMSDNRSQQIDLEVPVVNMHVPDSTSMQRSDGNPACKCTLILQAMHRSHRHHSAHMSSVHIDL
jgi:hypothetical protein